MIRNIRSAAVIMFAAVLINAPQKAAAQAEFIAEVVSAGAKEVASIAVNWAVDQLYNAVCKDAYNNTDFDDFVCTSMASMTGRAQADYQQAVKDGLADLQDSVARIEAGLAALSQGQAKILAALNLVGKKIDAVPTEVDAQTAVRNIRVLWRDRFSQLGTDRQPFTPERNIALARDIVGVARIHHSLGVLNDAMTGASLGGKGSWLEQQMDLILSGLTPSPATDLDAPYALYQSMMDFVLTKYGRGEMMYVWAARVLEDDCAQGTQSSCAVLPISLAGFRQMTQEHRTQQLAEFERMVERLVLSFSDRHSLNANFLHGDGIRVLTRADYFMALHLESRQGLRGRVISAGQAFSGALGISGMQYPTLGATRLIRTGAEVDWWQRTIAGKPYDVVHFVPGWTIHDIAIPNASSATFRLVQSLPWVSGPAKLVQLDARTGDLATAQTPADQVIRFGRFTAIARAGGAYAMMSDAWNLYSGGTDNTGHIHGTTTAPELDIYRSGSGIYTSKLPFDFSLRVEQQDVTPYIDRKSPVTFADGGTITLHGLFGDSGYLFPGARPGQLVYGVQPNTTIRYSTSFHNIDKAGRQASVDLSAGVFLGEATRSVDLRWATGLLYFSDPGAGSIEHEGYKSVSTTYAAGTTVKPAIRARANYYMPVSGLDKTDYQLFVGIAPKALHFTRN